MQTWTKSEEEVQLAAAHGLRSAPPVRLVTFNRLLSRYANNGNKKGGEVEQNNELIRMELTELYSFARHHFQLYFSWYTFFLTVNFVAIGWFTSVLLTGEKL